MDGCRSHRPFHHPDMETMATVPKVTKGEERRGIRRQKAQGGWNVKGKPEGRVAQIKAEPGTRKEREREATSEGQQWTLGDPSGKAERGGAR